MSLLTNNSLPVDLDVLFGLKVPTVVQTGTLVNGQTTFTVADATNIPSAGYLAGANIPAGATYTIAGTTVTMSSAATGSATEAITFSILPCILYFALYTSTPNAAGGGTEVTGGSYARVPVVNNPTNFPATTAQTKSNGTAIQWPVSTAAWNTIVAWGALDAPTGGNLWFYGSVTSVTMNSGDSIQFAVGQFALTF